MEIIYIITVLLLLISTMLIRKNNEKQNILFRGILTIVLFSTYNILLALIFSAIKLPSNLMVLSIANVIITIINTLILLIKQEVQKYFIKVQDVIFMIILFVLVIGIAYKQFAFPFDIKYESTDSAMHFLAAKNFYNNKILDGGIPAASVNTAILFDICDSIISEQNFYNIFIVFDISLLYLIGAIFYLGITNKTKSKMKSIFAMIFTILFICAYPLNSIIFGFSYLTVAILYITTLIVMAVNIKDTEQKQLPLCIEMFLIVLGIFFAYYFFVPVVYTALGLYILFDMIKNKKSKNIFSIFTIKNIVKVLTILVLPTIIGFGYFVLPSLMSTGKTTVGHISTEGYIYRDLYSNFILFAPLAIYYILYNIKNKKNNFSTILMIISSIFTVFLLIMGLKGRVSSYYYFKMYFLLWIVVLYNNIKAINILIAKKETILPLSFTGLILGLLLVAYKGYDYQITAKNEFFNPTNNINSYVNIYMYNRNTIKTGKITYTNTQLDAIKYLLSISENNVQIQGGSNRQNYWANAAWRLTDSQDVKVLAKVEELDIQKWLRNNNKKYLIYFDTTKDIQRQTNKYKTIYETQDVIILEKII